MAESSLRPHATEGRQYQTSNVSRGSYRSGWEVIINVRAAARTWCHLVEAKIMHVCGHESAAGRELNHVCDHLTDWSQPVRVAA
jgi:hypothetical protein